MNCSTSPAPGCATKSEGVDELRDLRLGLPDADRLDEDDVEDGGEHRDRRPGRLGEAAEPLARRHRAEEDARIAGVRAHADAVAEQCAARHAARRIDREDADRPAAARRRRTSASSSVDLPAPGAPVMPMRRRRRRGVASRARSSRRAARDPPRGGPAGCRRRGSAHPATASRSRRAQPLARASSLLRQRPTPRPASTISPMMRFEVEVLRRVDALHAGLARASRRRRRG